MQRAWKIFYWLVVNAGLACLLYSALQGVSGAQNVYVALIWFVAVLATGTVSDDYVKDNAQQLRDRRVPQAFNNIANGLFLGVLVWHGWWLTAIAYGWGWICMEVSRDKAGKLLKSAEVAAA